MFLSFTFDDSRFTFGTVAEWLGSALQKLLQRFESARYLHHPASAFAVCGIFFMLTPEEEKFVLYWQQQRLHKKGFLRKLSIGLPVFALLAVLFFANFLSGWYGKADKEIRRHSSLIVVILIAVVAIAVFVAIFASRHRWDQNESEYQRLLQRKAAGTAS